MRYVLSGYSPGLMLDSEIVYGTLASHDCAYLDWYNQPSRFERLLLRESQRFSWFFRNMQATYFYFEDVPRGWANLPGRHALFVNQEWMRPTTIKALKVVDVIFCKSHYAKKILDSKGYENTTYVGFCGRDSLLPLVRTRELKFFHLGGKSPNKGTATLLKIWASNPSWPLLTVVAHNLRLDEIVSADNIDLKGEPISLSSLKALQNSSSVHICPSRAEGFGHSISEALSVGALVVTTNAAPMNELVTTQCGFLLSAHLIESSEFNWGESFDFSDNDLVHTVNKILSMSDKEIEQMRIASRMQYETLRMNFRSRFMSELLLADL